MKKMRLVTVITLTFIGVGSLVACSKKENSPDKKNMKAVLQHVQKDLTPDEEILNALHVENPNRITIFKNALLEQYPHSDIKSITEIIAKDIHGVEYSWGYLVNGTVENMTPAPHTGWVLYNNGCFYHGTWDTVTNPDTGLDEEVFVPDSDPWGDNYIGNEPICLDADQFHAMCSPTTPPFENQLNYTL